MFLKEKMLKKKKKTPNKEKNTWIFYGRLGSFGQCYSKIQKKPFRLQSRRRYFFYFYIIFLFLQQLAHIYMYIFHILSHCKK